MNYSMDQFRKDVSTRMEVDEAMTREDVIAIEKAGAEWVVVEQDKPSMGLTPMECAAKSRAYLKTIGC